MTVLTVDTELAQTPPEPTPAPCLVRVGFIHPDGMCGCFFGGPAPEFGPPAPPRRFF